MWFALFTGCVAPKGRDAPILLRGKRGQRTTQSHYCCYSSFTHISMAAVTVGLLVSVDFIFQVDTHARTHTHTNTHIHRKWSKSLQILFSFKSTLVAWHESMKQKHIIWVTSVAEERAGSGTMLICPPARVTKWHCSAVLSIIAVIRLAWFPVSERGVTAVWPCSGSVQADEYSVAVSGIMDLFIFCLVPYAWKINIVGSTVGLGIIPWQWCRYENVAIVYSCNMNIQLIMA